MQDSKEILARLRKCPGLLTGKNTLQSIDAFFAGYWFATDRYKISTHDDLLLVPSAFHSWVAYRLHFSSSNCGWCKLIYERTNSEEEVINKFFDLYEEFLNRTPNIVAKFAGYSNEDLQRISNLTNIRFYSNPITLVTYTDDPGFFVYLDNEDNLPRRDFYNSLESFESNTDIQRHMLTVIDSEWKSKNF